MERTKLFSLIFVMALLAGLLAGAASASDDLNWPTRPVEIIVSMSAGGDTDFNARALARYLTEELGQPFVVTNITGGGGSIGTSELIHSPADGYRMMVAHAPLHTAQAFGITDYGWDDMAVISIFGQGTGEFLAVNADFPASTLEELIAHTSQNPGRYRFGYNPGATSHYIGVKMQLLGAEMNMVVAGSAADRVVGLLGGHLDIILAAMPNLADYVELGQFKIIANGASERHPNFPDIPTLMEQGLGGAFDPFYTLYTVKGVDPRIVARVNQAIYNIVMHNAAYQEEISVAFTQVPFFQSTEQAVETLAQQQQMYMSITDELRAAF